MIPLRNATSIAARRRGVVVNSFAPALTWQELTGERELTMTDGQARQKLLDFDRRYRLILGIADLIADSAAQADAGSSAGILRNGARNRPATRRASESAPALAQLATHSIAWFYGSLVIGRLANPRKIGGIGATGERHQHARHRL
jgi:hypothetical protein